MARPANAATRTDPGTMLCSGAGARTGSAGRIPALVGVEDYLTARRARNSRPPSRERVVKCSILTQPAKPTRVQETQGGLGNESTLMPVMLIPTLTKMPVGMANCK
jgi:hypothetical protein